MGNSGQIGGIGAVLMISALIAATSVNANLLDSFNIHSVESFCEKTDYKDICMRTVGKVLNSSSPEEAVRVSFKVAAEEVDRANEYSHNVSQLANDQYNKNAFEDCRNMMRDATEELQASLIEAHDLQTIMQRSDDIKTWLSAVITYQQTCLDGFKDPEIKEKMNNGLRIVAQVTSNAIAFVEALEELLKTFDIPNVNLNSTTGRRLLPEEGKSHSKYPSWFSFTDRKLLQTHASGSVTPNAVVAKDGSGDFKTITDAINSMPKFRSERYIIYVKAGTYKEKVFVTKEMTQLFMYGDGARKTIVTGSLNVIDDSSIGTMHTATFSVEGQGFICKQMGFSNTAGPEKHQAVALRVQADRAAFFNCRMDAYQDTLYVHAHRQFYRNCVVSGTVDFIFGDSRVVLQNCLIIVRRPMDKQKNTVTAQGAAEKRSVTGIVIHNCRIVPDRMLTPDRLKIKSYLGRPWKAFSKTVVMESTIGDLIDPEGWLAWQGENFEKTCYYAEYGNSGPGAGTSGRVKWPGYHVINKQTASKYTSENFIGASEWLPYTGINYFSGFKV